MRAPGKTWPSMLGQALGGEATGEGDELRRAAVRQLILTELAYRLGELPPALASAWVPPSTEQRRRTIELFESWRRDSRRRESYAALASEIDVELGLSENLFWAPPLADCDATPAIEEIAFAESIRLLAAGRLDDALASRSIVFRAASGLVTRFLLRSPTDALWTRAGAPSPQSRLFVTRLRRMPAAGSVASQLTWYVDRGWRRPSSQAARTALSELRTLGDLEPRSQRPGRPTSAGSSRSSSTSLRALETEGLDVGDLVRQGDPPALRGSR